jgi:nondiscriminating glutamyl-tRNA synthetase
MTVRVRFAPSPTGHLHIGGARTALYSFIYAKAMGGDFILRIEDTDLERSSREFEKSQIADLKWIGIDYKEGPDTNGAYGPYRQSERLSIYKDHALKLIDEGKAFYCFCTEEELEAKKEQATREKRAPHYDGKCRNLSSNETSSRLSAGESASIRFKAPRKSYMFTDVVRGRVVFPEDMVGDFVILRSSGLPVYNYCCVVDDALMKMTHVLRAEEHLPNTLRQLMLYEAFNYKIPEFGHVSLLVGKDRQKLSKRHGATSLTNYKELGYLPSAMMNYLVLLGWSHPEEKEVFDLEELCRVFSLDRFSKSPALFDIDKLNFINGEHIKKLALTELRQNLEVSLDKNHAYFKQDEDWKNRVVKFFQNHLTLFTDFSTKLADIFSLEAEQSPEIDTMKTLDSTLKIKQYFATALEGHVNKGQAFLSEADYQTHFDNVKSSLGLKGKPLFMGIRLCLTLRGHGPELKDVIPLTPIEVLLKRLNQL